MTLDLNKLTDAELRELIQLPDDTAGLRYYMPKAAKVEFLLTETEERRLEILEGAKARRDEHHAYLRHRRKHGSPDRQALIEERMGGQAWRFLTERRVNGSYTDSVTGRKAKIAYIVEGTQDERRLMLTKATLLDAHERLGLIVGWPPTKERVRAPEAKAAGLTSGAEVASRLGDLRSSE